MAEEKHRLISQNNSNLWSRKLERTADLPDTMKTGRRGSSKMNFPENSALTELRMMRSLF